MKRLNINPKARKELLDFCDQQFPQDTLAPGEAYLTLSRFHTFLRTSGHVFGKTSVYRWTKVPKEGLPPLIQDILKPAPSAWLLSTLSHTKDDRWNNIIPLRYLDPSLHDQAAPFLHYKQAENKALATIQTVQHAISLAQRQLDQLAQNLTGKDHAHAAH